MGDNVKKNTIEDKLSTIKYNCDNKTHLNVEQTKCKTCTKRVCTVICPAKVYSYDDATDTLKVEYENCLECGACRIACENKAINWEYPRSSKGVIYKNS